MIQPYNMMVVAPSECLGRTQTHMGYIHLLHAAKIDGLNVGFSVPHSQILWEIIHPPPEQ